MTGGTARKLDPIFNNDKELRSQRHLHARRQDDGLRPLERRLEKRLQERGFVDFVL
ncbi:MAG: hypothetical protein WKG07_21920 [Hymenobacter sp.]